MELEGNNTYPSILEKNIHEIAKVRTYKKGEKIFSEGEALEDIYLIKSGIVKLTRKKSDEKTPILVGIFKDNQFIGELNLEDRSRISRTTATMIDRGNCMYLV
jgi:CRP/FNR family transcriptional regulator, cyclic AMP receptor protein